MRRVLLLSYWVPPRNAIGTIRSAHLQKHLSKFGWDVHTVTARFDGPVASAQTRMYVQTGYCDVKGAAKRLFGIGSRSTHEALNVAVPAYGAKRTLVQRLIYGAGSLITYPDEHIGWLPFASRSVQRLLKQQTFDAILTTSPPVTTNLAAALSRGRTPWVADLRDLWAEDDSSERSTLQVLFDDKLERLCLSRAAALTASSDLSARRFEHRYSGKPCFPISTGFDADEWRNVPFNHESVCTLLYAGTLYRGKRDPSLLFAAVRDILEEGLAARDELRIDFYTHPEPWLLELVARFGLGDVVRVKGFMERAQVLAAERRAARLLVFSWDGPTAEGIVAGKIFEYFGARRPVLAIGGPAASSVQALLSRTAAGVGVRTLQDTKAELLGALREHRSGTLRVIAQEAVRDYTGEACARQFGAVLDYAVRRAPRRDTSAATPIPANTAKNGILEK